MFASRPGLRGLLLSSVAAVLAAGAVATPVVAQEGAASARHTINIPAQSLASGIQALSEQTDAIIVASGATLGDRRGSAVTGALTVEQALGALLRGTGLTWRRDANGAYAIVRASQPAQDAPIATRDRSEAPPAPMGAPGDDDATMIEEVIVTARRREEGIQDVPIAVSAFTNEQLETLRIETGGELLRAIPNVNFSKDNFTSYSFVIRGIGAEVQATTADPGVAISYNNTPLLRNRLFEQEYFDVQRLEVLRGPQGTLYGRNATAGVVNMLPNLPELGDFYGEIQGELGNYASRRLRGFLNIPLGDTLALRVAGASTQRDGFDFNTVTDQAVNGRDLWGTRVGLLWEPNDRFRVNFLWERFREDDDRARTGKMLCTRGETPDSIEWTSPDGVEQSHPTHAYWTRTTITPGCTPNSLYSDDAYGVPDGRTFPITASLINMTGVFVNPRWTGGGRPPTGYTSSDANGWDGTYLFPLYLDPFAVEGNRQVADLRTISTAYDPQFRAENDVFQLNLEWEMSPGLTLHSQTLYMEDYYSGFQDFFRTYATGQMYAYETPGIVHGLPRTIDPRWAPWFGPSVPGGRPVYDAVTGAFGDGRICGPLPGCGIPTGGVFLDPQLGATDRFMALDASQAESNQWSQEFRLQSDWDGPFNFNLGANWLRYQTEENYWIFSNIFTLMAAQQNTTYFGSGLTDQYCNLTAAGQAAADAGTFNPQACTYIDPTPLAGILAGEGGDGHNYIRNISINQTQSWSVFGEGYWELRDDLRLTLGLRYTDDTKTMTPVPGQLLAAVPDIYHPTATGQVGQGYPVYPDEELNWGEWTGRAVIDWSPELAFTDETMVYASFSRGYKGGGGNPRDRDYNPALIDVPILPSRYDPEFVNAYEIGMRNILANGRVMLNATAFFYDYEGYQVAQIMERAIHNENFDARIWGLEFEAAWTPIDNLRIDTTLGFLRTRIGDGEESIDVMNRTQGNPDWSVVRPWPGSPSTCIVPNDILGRIANAVDFQAGRTNYIGNIAFMRSLCPSIYYGGTWVPGSDAGFNYADRWSDQWQALFPLNWNPLTDAPNGGRGFAADLSGNSLPNAPNWTFNIGAQYRLELGGNWDVVLRGDYYRQSDSWMRVYNTEYDRLQGWGNGNISASFSNGEMTFQVYVKNVFDDTPITDGFTGPDELGNFTNVFTLDPRIIGVSARAVF